MSPLTPRQSILAGALAVVVAASRLLAVARSPWDWDEMLFSLGMRAYDVAQHHPHPPGFPLFIGLAKFVRVVLIDDFRSLQTVSIIASMLLFPAVLMLARELGFRAETAMAGAALCAFFPNVWFFGGTAFSDLPSIVLAVFAAALLLRGRRDARAYVAGALLLAAAAAIRPQNLLVGIYPAASATLHRIRVSWRPVTLAALGGAAILSLCYGGAIAATGGLDRFMTAVTTHADYIARTDSFRSPLRPPPWRLFDDFFVRNYQSPVFGGIVTLLVAASLLSAARTRGRSIGELLLTFAPFALLAWLMLDRFSISRFSIGYAPLFALLAAHGIETLTRGRAAMEVTIAAALTAGFVAYTLPALAVVRREDSPTVRAVRAARSIGGPHQLYVAHSMVPFAEYFLPREPFLRVAGERSLPLGSPAVRPWLLTTLSATSPRELTFRRAHGRLWNIARRQYFDVALTPIAVLPQFVSGWYAPERLGAEEWRWTSGHAVTQLPSANGETILGLELDIPDERRPPTITIALNGVVIDSFRPTAGRMTKEYSVAGAAANLLEITVDPIYNSAREKTGADDRELGVLVRELSWGPAR